MSMHVERVDKSVIIDYMRSFAASIDFLISYHIGSFLACTRRKWKRGARRQQLMYVWQLCQALCISVVSTMLQFSTQWLMMML